MENTELIQDINHSLAIDLPQNISFTALHQMLSAHVNHLIKTNFDALVALLYKIDVDENKLKHFLIDAPNEDAGDTIATLIIERQQQKLIYKKQFFKTTPPAEDEEKW